MIRALIVEDDLLLGRAMGRILSRRDVDVVDVVGDAETALQRLEVDAVDVVITDYELGPCSPTGVDLAAAIHARWPGVPIILASGSIDAAVRTTALAAGIDACFTKPVAIEPLVATLQRLAGQRQVST